MSPKFVLHLAIVALGICAAAATICPDEVIEDARQMRKVSVNVNAPGSWPYNGWKLKLKFDKPVGLVDGEHAKEEKETKGSSGMEWEMVSENWNKEVDGIMRVPIQLKQLRSRVPRPNIVSIQIASLKKVQGALKFYELCEPEDLVQEAAPPAPPPCSDFYTVQHSHDGGYEGKLRLPFYYKSQVGFNFAITMDNIASVYVDGVKRV